jgi:FKBP-type peptidyl-prolyl cis-trans isomerase SlpA
MSKADSLPRLPLRDLEREAPTSQPAPKSPSAITTVQQGSKLTLHFALLLPNGEVIDSNFAKEPVSFVVGDGNLLPGFERALLGLPVEAQVDVLIAASQAFGVVNPDNQQRFPRYLFAPTLALSENLLVEFADARGYSQAGRVVSITSKDVEIDFNHPLAGYDIRFLAKIYSIA